MAPIRLQTAGRGVHIQDTAPVRKCGADIYSEPVRNRLGICRLYRRRRGQFLKITRLGGKRVLKFFKGSRSARAPEGHGPERFPKVDEAELHKRGRAGEERQASLRSVKDKKSPTVHKRRETNISEISTAAAPASSEKSSRTPIKARRPPVCGCLKNSSTPSRLSQKRASHAFVDSGSPSALTARASSQRDSGANWSASILQPTVSGGSKSALPPDCGAHGRDLRL